MKIKEVERELNKIKQRNKRVELDKAWELSWTRRLFLILLTYIVIVIFFYSAGLPRPWLNSIVPALAFVISTLTLPLFKKLWIKSRI